MKFSKINRSTHNWLSIFVVLPVLLIMVTGILLVLKKDFEWIQPPTHKGQSKDIPNMSMTDVFNVVTTTPEARGLKWDQFERIEFKPSKGIMKFVTPDAWEIQVDPSTGEVLSVMKRRSDIIESLHDGNFFGSSMKYFLSLPTAIILIILSLTGVYMFFHPILKKRARKKQKS